MAKDFGDDVLPLLGGYLSTRQLLPTMQANWLDTMESLLELHSSCAQARGVAGWIQTGGAGIMLLLPRDSAMRARWSHPALDLGLGNHTALNSTDIV